MAPDINTLPDSPRLDRTSMSISPPTSADISRPTSQIMGPPAAPASAILTSSTNVPFSSLVRSPPISTQEQTGIPLRHPRPLTAAELYLECEKEQEAVVCSVKIEDITSDGC